MDCKEPDPGYRPPAYNEPMFAACGPPARATAPPEYTVEFSSYPPGHHHGADDFTRDLPPPYDSPVTAETSVQTDYGACHILPSEPQTHQRLETALSTSRPTVHTVYPPERYGLYPSINEHPVSRQDSNTSSTRPQSPPPNTRPQAPNRGTSTPVSSRQSRGGRAARQSSSQMQPVRRDPPSNLGMACAACILFPPLGIIAFIYAGWCGFGDKCSNNILR